MSKIQFCPYCGEKAKLVGGETIYPHRADLFSKLFWHCEPCGAWVGCHDGTTEALGRLANAELRAWKQRAHAAFDPLWKAKLTKGGCKKKSARGAGYQWLAASLGIAVEKCHIGMFDVETCRRVVEICQPITARIQGEANV